MGKRCGKKASKQKSQMPYWAAFVLCHNSEAGKISGSFLSFWAQNRFQAMKAIEHQLPENPVYLDEKGQPRPFSLLDLRQIKPQDTEIWATHFCEFFSDEFLQNSSADLSNLN